METTEYDLYDLLIGDDDISAIGDGSVTGAISSLSTSITNLVQVQYVSLNFGTINGAATGTKTATVTACPTGYTTMIVPKFSSWCIVNAISVSGTTLSVSVMNTTTDRHTCSCGVYVIYYPSTWNI